jgi:sugar phosphate isomerase/epimerase
MSDPGGAALWLSCADFSFPRLAHGDAAQLVAMLGYPAIDVGVSASGTHVHVDQVRDDPVAAAARVRAAIGTAGIAVADVLLVVDDLASGAVNHPDPARRTQLRRVYRQTLVFAAAIGAPGLTVLPGIAWPDERWEDSLERAADELRWRLAIAREHGLGLSIEPHVNSVCETPDRVRALVGACNGLKLTVDYSHMRVLGIADEDVEPLLGHARHVHVRGARHGALQTPLRRSAIDHGRMLEALIDAGYRGYVASECIPAGGDGEHAVEDCDHLSEAAELRDLVQATSQGRPA